MPCHEPMSSGLYAKSEVLRVLYTSVLYCNSLYALLHAFMLCMHFAVMHYKHCAFMYLVLVQHILWLIVTVYLFTLCPFPRYKRHVAREFIKRRTLKLMNSDKKEWEEVCQQHSALGDAFLEKWLPYFLQMRNLSGKHYQDPADYATAVKKVMHKIVVVEDQEAVGVGHLVGTIVDKSSVGNTAELYHLDGRELFKYGSIFQGKEIVFLHIDPPFGMQKEEWDEAAWQEEGKSCCFLLACLLIVYAFGA